MASDRAKVSISKHFFTVGISAFLNKSNYPSRLSIQLEAPTSELLRVSRDPTRPPPKIDTESHKTYSCL